VTQLLKTARGKIVIIVIVDRLSKQYHLVATRNEIISIETAKLFVEKIYSQHGMPRSIVLDRNAKFTVQFWQALMTILEMSLDISLARHSETNE
jgi:hypothetical protein